MHNLWQQTSERSKASGALRDFNLMAFSLSCMLIGAFIFFQDGNIARTASITELIFSEKVFNKELQMQEN